MQDIHALLKLMSDRGASELFLTVGAAPHLRIGSETEPVGDKPIANGEVKAMAHAIMKEEQARHFEVTKEANFARSVDHIGRFRINVYYQRGEVAMVIRLTKSRIPSFAELGLPTQAAELAMLRRGLVLVVGGPGSGKSATLAAMIDHRSINAGGHILTIEDPIEFLFPHRKALVDQREVGIDTQSYADALHNAMREGPDVVVIGEIRDREAAQHAIAYAEAGRLCIATLIANGVDQAIERFTSLFPEDARKQVLWDLSLNLKGIIAQRLLRSMDGKRALATEVLLTTPYVAELVEKGNLAELRNVVADSNAMGMKTFDQSLYELFMAHRVTYDEAIRHADSHTDLALKLRLSRHQSADDAPDFSMDGSTTA
ncbi:MAG TPA: PilT/PilU family type 4a pilus ATPase [Noviherbaspirillum sp.]